MATEKKPVNVGQSRKHLDQIITLKNEDICSLSSVFLLKNKTKQKQTNKKTQTLHTSHDFTALLFDMSSKEEVSPTNFK